MEQTKFDIDNLYFESRQRLRWFIDGIGRHGMPAKMFIQISTERLCEMYNVEMEFFMPKNKNMDAKG